MDAKRFNELHESMEASSDFLLGEPIDGIYPATIVFEGDSPKAFREMLSMLGTGVYLMDTERGHLLKAQAVVKVDDTIIYAYQGAGMGLKMYLADDGCLYGEILNPYDVLKALRSEI